GAVVLTHGHLDHVGSLPALVEGGWGGVILATRATWAIARIVIRDGLVLEGATPDDAERFVGRLDALHRPAPYNQPGMVHDGVFVAFREAGHILGSASVELRSAKSRVILSGDLGRPDTPILRAYNRTWEADRPVDLVVLETTYGDREHTSDHAHIREELLRILERAVERGGHVLVPAFAIGRTQILLYHLNALVESGRLKDVPVVLDSPMGLEVTETYAAFRNLYDKAALDRLAYGDDPLDFDGLFAVKRARDSERLRERKGPTIVVASSGMCTGGRIVGHLQELLPKEETCVMFVGYQARGTPGRAILEAAKAREERGGVPTVRVGGEEVEVRASVEMLSGLSAHADRQELKEWLLAVPDVRRVALHHGEPEAQAAFARWVAAGG
ncbi:MAG: MBL fold metallo-hydrolase RNA specificity domain-containing protein, partial [Myxococcota bacterium]